ncbi:MAG: hypothetical protein KDA28_04110, partial [Phycisphaerales bacterium]|nr:hypothetical protein [Phycisphaerales bacterium]
MLDGTIATTVPLGLLPEDPDAGVAWLPGPGLVVHEWGTFTSVQSSDGGMLEGLHHEEHALPSFVYGRASSAEYFECPPTKCMEMHPEGVTQKLETPVLYFYSQEPVEVSVDVSFPNGILSEWYPDVVSYAPELYDWDIVADGEMSWTVDVVPGPVDVIPVPEEDIWAPSRRVASTPVFAGGEAERFIFYRGLGDFTLPFVVESLEGGGLRIRNDSEDTIPAVFVHYVDPEAGEGMIASVGPLPPLSELVIEDPTFVPGPKEEPLPVDELVPFASDLVAAELVASGLFADEARAMVDTWSTSYFGSEG